MMAKMRIPKMKVPKRIAGFKVPKRIRKSAVLRGLLCEQGGEGDCRSSADCGGNCCPQPRWSLSARRW